MQEQKQNRTEDKHQDERTKDDLDRTTDTKIKVQDESCTILTTYTNSNNTNILHPIFTKIITTYIQNVSIPPWRWHGIFRQVPISPALHYRGVRWKSHAEATVGICNRITQFFHKVNFIHTMNNHQSTNSSFRRPINVLMRVPVTYCSLANSAISPNVNLLHHAVFVVTNYLTFTFLKSTTSPT